MLLGNLLRSVGKRFQKINVEGISFDSIKIKKVQKIKIKLFQLKPVMKLIQY